MAKLKKTSTKKNASKARSTTTRSSASKRGFSPKAKAAVKKAAEELWDVGVPPHILLQEVRDVLLLRCLEQADGNYAAAATMFGPSRQSVQQYANSPLRDARWKPYQQNKRRR